MIPAVWVVQKGEGLLSLCLKPACLEPVLCRRNHSDEKPGRTTAREEEPPQLEKSPSGNEDPAQPKISKTIKYVYIYMKFEAVTCILKMQITDNFSSRFYLKTIRRKQPWEKTASRGASRAWALCCCEH